MARASNERISGNTLELPRNREAEAEGEHLTRAGAGNIIEGSRLEPGAPGSKDKHRMICEASYYKAEQRGFAPGAELDDWLAAEREVEEREGKGVVG